MPSFMDRMKNLVGAGPPPEPETLPQQLLRQVDEATTLSWRQVSNHIIAVSISAVSASDSVHALGILCLLQRAIGFGITFGVGLLFSFMVSYRPEVCSRLQQSRYISCDAMRTGWSYSRQVVAALPEQC